jgi:predicted RecB family endonuclease
VRLIDYEHLEPVDKMILPTRQYSLTDDADICATKAVRLLASEYLYCEMGANLANSLSQLNTNVAGQTTKAGVSPAECAEAMVAIPMGDLPKPICNAASV